MLYNEKLYNGGSYNLTVTPLALFDSSSMADARISDPAIVKAEVQAMVAAIQFLFNQAPLLQDVMVMEQDFTTKALIVKLESLGLTDTTTISFIKLLSDTIGPSDALVFLASMALGDAVAIADDLTKKITNKGLSDTIRMAEWLSVNRRPAEGVFGD